MKQTAIRYGLMLGLISIAFSLVSNIMGFSDPRDPNTMMGILMGVLSFGISIFIIVLALKHYRDELNNGIMSLGQAISVGIMVALVSGLIAAVFSVLYYTVIDPGYFDTILEGTRQKMEDNGMDDDQIDQAMRITSMFSNPIVTFFATLLSSAFVGLIISLIAGLIMKREPATGA